MKKAVYSKPTFIARASLSEITAGAGSPPFNGQGNAQGQGG